MRKVRNFLALTLVVFMLFSLLPVGAFAEVGVPVNTNENSLMEAKEKTVIFTIDQKSYKVGDQIVETDVAPYIKDLGNSGGRIMVPVAFVAPALGTEPAKWFPNDQMVLITKGEKEITIFIGKNEMLVNGKKIPLDVAAEIKDIGNGGGRTMLPIAFIARALEIGFEWEGATRSVYFYGYTKTYDQKGTFGPDSGIQTIDGSVVVKADGVILRNLLIKGNLTIAEEVGDGDVTLNNITVKGETFIRGGGKDSIHINGGEYSNIIIQNVNGQVRVVAKDATGAQVVVAEEVQGEEIIFEGTFEKVTVEAKGAKIITQGQTTINLFEITETAVDTEIQLSKDTIVKEIVIQARADIQGDGFIEKAQVQVNDVYLGITPKEQNIATGVTPPRTDGGDSDKSSPKKSQSAPKELKGILPTSVANNDGKITGTTSKMEYRLKGDTSWNAVKGNEIVDLEPGTYEVRYKAKSGYYPGKIAEVVVPEYEIPEEPEIEKYELHKKIIAARELKEENYTEESWKEFVQALVIAQEVLANQKATQEEVDEVVLTLSMAIKSLIEVVEPINVSITADPDETNVVSGFFEKIFKLTINNDKFSENVSEKAISLDGVFKLFGIKDTILNKGNNTVTTTVYGNNLERGTGIIIFDSSVLELSKNNISVKVKVLEEEKEPRSPKEVALEAIMTMNINRDASELTVDTLMTAGVTDVNGLLLDRYKHIVENTTHLENAPDIQNLIYFVNAQSLIQTLVIFDEESQKIIGIIEDINQKDIDLAQSMVDIITFSDECDLYDKKVQLQNAIDRIQGLFNDRNAPEVAVTGVTLDHTILELTVGKKEGILVATVLPDNATDKSLIWASSDTSVAVVEDGVVTAISAGTATIKVMTVDGDFTASCSINIVNPPDITGSGTESDPFIINTFAGLEKIGTAGYPLEAYYKLDANIDATETEFPEYNNGQGWKPIANDKDGKIRFSGVFDGNNHKISNLYINGYYNVGLFGNVNGSITNVELENINIKGYQKVGSLVGNLLGGSISNVTVSGSVEGTENIGGIVGEAIGSDICISNSSSNVSVKATNYYAGGLVGHTNGVTIDNSHTTGDVSGNSAVGGLVGWCEDTEFTDCYTIGDISSLTSKAGGLVGTCFSSGISNSYACGIIYGNNMVGGLVGYCSLTNISNSYALNPSIIYVTGASAKYFGRIIGRDSNGNILNNNYANKDMTEPFTGAFNAKSHNGKDGGNLESFSFNDNGELIVKIED